ncbi:DPY30 domain containing 2 [Cricetulus griseus]
MEHCGKLMDSLMYRAHRRKVHHQRHALEGNYGILTPPFHSPYFHEVPSMETDYLKKCFGNSLTQALAEVARVRPSDPIEYLALLLYHYGNVNNDKEKKRQEELQLKEEHDRVLKEANMTQILKQEENQIQQNCEQCQQELLPKALSSNKTPALQEDTAPLEKETKSPESQPSVSSVIAEMPQRVFTS